MRLTPELLLSAYASGIFPMAYGEHVYWFAPDPRAILPLDGLHVSRSLRRSILHGGFELRVNSAFTAVIEACALPGPGRGRTWISPEFIDAYTYLHHLGFAHSVETWLDGELVGGLYGVSLRGFFAGESMFSRRPDASKVALYHLVSRLRARDFRLLDVQYLTPHLESLGAVEVPRWQYHELLKEALTVETRFLDGETG